MDRALRPLILLLSNGSTATGLSEMDAYELLSKVAKIHVDQMVDPNYTVVAKINKKYLPPLKSTAK